MNAAPVGDPRQFPAAHAAGQLLAIGSAGLGRTVYNVQRRSPGQVRQARLPGTPDFYLNIRSRLHLSFET